jgi:hypothetical protein
MMLRPWSEQWAHRSKAELSIIYALQHDNALQRTDGGSALRLGGSSGVGGSPSCLRILRGSSIRICHAFDMKQAWGEISRCRATYQRTDAVISQLKGLQSAKSIATLTFDFSRTRHRCGLAGRFCRWMAVNGFTPCHYFDLGN